MFHLIYWYSFELLVEVNYLLNVSNILVGGLVLSIEVVKLRPI